MKKTITLLAMAFCINANAQLINQGFETWTNDALAPTAMQPNSGNATTGWWTYNMFNNSFVGGSPISVFRCDTFHSGLHSARIETVIYTPTSYSYTAPWGVPFIGHNYLDTLGILFNGNTNESATPSYKPGIPFTQNINQFSFWYQYKPNGIDSAECRVLLVKNRQPVAGGLVKIHTATGSQWTQATITMAYVSGLTPDTLYILFSSSSLDKKPKPGSIFWVDDVSVTLFSGISQYALNSQIAVYPNPSNGVFDLKMSGFENLKMSSVEVYNSLGEMVYQSTIQQLNHLTIDISNQPAGIYILQTQGKHIRLIKE